MIAEWSWRLAVVALLLIACTLLLVVNQTIKRADENIQSQILLASMRDHPQLLGQPTD